MDRGVQAKMRTMAVMLLALVALGVAQLAPSSARAALSIEPGTFLAGSYADEGPGKYGSLGIGSTPDVRAGGHPFLSATSFTFKTHPVGTGYLPDGLVKDIIVKLPPGFVGNPTATPLCRQERLVQVGFCPNETVVGVVYLPILAFPFGGNGADRGPEGHFAVPVYNMKPAYGEPALLGFYIENPSFVTLIHLGLDAARNYAITATVKDAAGIATVYSTKLAVWGVPSNTAHNRWRGYRKATGAVGDGCLVSPGANDNGPGSSGNQCFGPLPARPFLANPAMCDGQPVTTTIYVDSWGEQGRFDSEGEPDLSDPNWSTDVAEAPAVEGCENLGFGGPGAPVSLRLQPSVRGAGAPSGYEAKLKLPYSDDPDGLAHPPLRDTTVEVPEGVVVNPSSANGLDACTSAEIGLATPVGQTPIRFDGSPDRCPAASKIGTVGVETPLVDHTLKGSVYLAKQFDNPFGSLLAIYIVVEDPETGTIIKLPGRVEADEASGKLTTTFSDNPQLPFTELDLDLFGGPGASLVNPSACGTHTTMSELVPWSAPQTPAVTSPDSFTVDQGCDGGGFSPRFRAGTSNPVAGSSSPFTLSVSRESGERELKSLRQIRLPEGLLGRVASVPLCGEAQAAAGTCPESSRIGRVQVAAGPGSTPLWVPQAGKSPTSVSLTGPYKGAPYGLSIVVPAQAGPFDLGRVVVRSALHVDERTAAITSGVDETRLIDTDGTVTEVLPGDLPRILKGIVLNQREIRVIVDRSDFMINPTDCSQQQVTAEISAYGGGQVSVGNRFQVGECASLGFAPRFRAKILDKGRRSTLRSWHPRTRFTVVPRKGDANIGGARVALPSSTILDQANIGTTCTRAQMAARSCPAESVVGYARAWSPLLRRAVEGPVYLAANGGVRPLPDLAAVLDGEIRVVLQGEISTLRSGGKARLQNTFRVVPDAPVERFVLTMRGGKNTGLLVNSTDLCRSRERGVAVFHGQNGRRSRSALRLATAFKGCRKVRRQAAKKAARRKAARKSAAGQSARRSAARSTVRG